MISKTILAIFDLQFAPILPTKFKSTGLLVQEKKRKIDFQGDSHGSHLGFLIETILTICGLQVIVILPIKFRISWPFGSWDEKQNRFSRWPQPWISQWNDFSYFDLHNALIFPTKFESIGLSVQEKKCKIDFQDGGHGSQLGFPIGTILAIFDLQVTLVLPTRFRSTSLLNQEEKFKKRIFKMAIMAAVLEF